MPIDYDKVPWGIYCHPEVGFCGLTEAQAKERGYDVVTSVHRWGGNGRALIIGETEGVMKIVAERDGPILGVHIAGPWATELIAEGYLSVNWEATPADVGLLIHAHPTLVGAVRRVGARAHRPVARLARAEHVEEVPMDVTMPQLGETVTEGTITRWFKQSATRSRPTSRCSRSRPTRSTPRCPRHRAGYLTEIVVPEGETVPSACASR